MGNAGNMLGFGLMRLPENEIDGEKVVDIEQVKDMVDAFMRAGFTYFDTAFGYHGGRSEVAAKEALVDRYRARASSWRRSFPRGWRKTPMRRSACSTSRSNGRGAGYFDCYLLHNLGEDRTKLFDDFGLWDFAYDLRERGLARKLGFSIHDKADALEAVLAAHPDVDFVQLQINYADWESPKIESRKCYEVARAREVPVIVMEPIKGGSLVRLSDEARAPLCRSGSCAVCSLVGASLRRIASRGRARAVGHVDNAADAGEHRRHA